MPERIPPDWINHINEIYIKDTPKTDLNFYDIEASKLNDKLERLNYWIYWIIGNRGIGKSTLIEETKKFNEKFAIERAPHARLYKYKRIHFDARSFPERKDLWDGFILNFVKELSWKEKEVDKLLAQIDGRLYYPSWLKIILIWWIVLTAIRYVWDFLLNEETIIRSILGIVLAVFLSLLIPISNFINDINKDPAQRVITYQKVFRKWLIKRFKKSIKKSKRYVFKKKPDYHKIVVVLEDIDRSGDEWIFFLETLKNFFDKNKFPVSIVFICPITEDSLRNNFQKYLKCFEDYEFFTKKSENRSFIENVFCEFDHWIASEGDKFKIFYQLIGDINRTQRYTPRETKYLIRYIYDKYMEKSFNQGYGDLIIFFITHWLYSQKQKNTNDEYYIRIGHPWDNQLHLPWRPENIKLFLKLIINSWHLWNDIKEENFTGGIFAYWDEFTIKKLEGRSRGNEPLFDIIIPEFYKP